MWMWIMLTYSISTAGEWMLVRMYTCSYTSTHTHTHLVCCSSDIQADHNTHSTFYCGVTYWVISSPSLYRQWSVSIQWTIAHTITLVAGAVSSINSDWLQSSIRAWESNTKKSCKCVFERNSTLIPKTFRWDNKLASDYCWWLLYN